MGKIPYVPWDSSLLFVCCLSICTPLLDTRGLCWRALRHTSHSRSVRFFGFRFARRLHSLPAVYELFYFLEEIVSFWHKGRLKFRDNAGSYIHIATPFYLLEEEVLFGFPEHHSITHFRHPPQSYTEIKLVTDSVPQILFVRTLAGENQEERRPCGFTGGYAGCVLQKGRYARLH